MNPRRAIDKETQHGDTQLLRQLFAFLARIALGLQKRPEYLLILGIATLGVFGGGVLGLLDGHNPIGYFIVGPCFFGILGVIVIIERQTRFTPPVPPPLEPGPQPIDEVRTLIEEISKLLELAKRPLTKRNLKVHIHILDTPSAKSRRVRVHLKAEYQVTNKSTEPMAHPATVAVEAAQSVDEQITGHLTVEDATRGDSIVNKPILLAREADPRGIEHLYSEDVVIPAQATYAFFVTVDEYLIDIPYAEFWATSQPLFGFELFLVTPPECRLVPRAQCYRPAHASGTFDSRAQDGTLHARATGPFLPFQGIFVQLRQAPTAR